MPEGSCVCGATRIAFTGEPMLQVLLPRPLHHPSSNSALPAGPLPLQRLPQGQLPAHRRSHTRADGRQITGSTYSTNVVVPGEGFAVTAGTPKLFAKKGDSGAEVVSHFCDTCGTTLFRDGASFGESKVVKAGVLEGKGVLVSCVRVGVLEGC